MKKYYELFAKLINCQVDNGQVVGYTTPSSVSIEQIDKFVKIYRAEKNELAQLLNPDNIKLLNAILDECITFEEFIKTYQGKAKISLERPFEHGFHSIDQLPFSIEKYTPDVDGYFSMMQEYSPSLADFFLSMFYPHLSDEMRRGHTYLTGATGSGKSEFMKVFCINHIKKNNCAVVVIDPKGDFALEIAKAKINLEPQHRSKLVIFDPYLSPSHTPVLNPFDQFEKDEHSIDLTTQELTRALGEIFSDYGAEFTNRMETLLGAALSTLLRTPNSTLWDLQRFMTDDCDDLIELGKNSPNEAHRRIFMNGEFEETAYKETKRGIYDRIQKLLTTSTFANIVTGKSTFNLKQAIDNKSLIVINLAKGRMGNQVSKSFGRLILTMLQVIALQRDGQPPEKRVPCHVFIDEFQNYLSKTLKEILTELRAYELFLTFANQLVGQDIDSNFTKIILGNTKIKIVGKSGRHNMNEMSKEIGVDVDRLRKLETGEFYVKVDSGEPFKLKISDNYLGQKYCMNLRDWEEIKKEQVQKYYVQRNKEIQRLKQIDLNRKGRELKEKDTPAPPFNRTKGDNKRTTPPEFNFEI